MTHSLITTNETWLIFKKQHTNHENETLTVQISGPPNTAKKHPTRNIAGFLEKEGYKCTIREESAPLTNEIFAIKKRYLQLWP